MSNVPVFDMEVEQECHAHLFASPMSAIFLLPVRVVIRLYNHDRGYTSIWRGYMYINAAFDSTSMVTCHYNHLRGYM